MTTITRNDWLAAVAEAGRVEMVPPDPNLLSMQELAAMLGCCRTAAAPRVARLVAAGKAERTTKLVQRSDGRWINVTAYRLIRGTQP